MFPEWIEVLKWSLLVHVEHMSCRYTKLIEGVYLFMCSGFLVVFNVYLLYFVGVPGMIVGVDVDTSFFTGNYTPQVSIQAACIESMYL